jgi:hypothetical protein
MGDFPRHQELERVFGPCVAAKIQKALIDDLGTGFSGNIAARRWKTRPTR